MLVLWKVVMVLGRYVENSWSKKRSNEAMCQDGIRPSQINLIWRMETEVEEYMLN